MRSLLAALIVATLPFATALAEAPKPLTLTRITPAGDDVEAARQITFEFNRPVVPLGRMERNADEVPITISPKAECQWRWINPSTLACQLDDKHPLNPATRYTVEVGTGITAEDGGQLARAQTHHFLTQRPDVRYQWFSSWRDPSTPEIRVIFTQPVERRSVQQSLYFRTAEGSTDALVEAVADDTNAPIKTARDEARGMWLVRPSKALPAGANTALVLTAGLVTPLGGEASVAARDLVAFDTYPEFSLQGITCTALDDSTLRLLPGNGTPTGKCDPQSPVTLSFTSPVSRAAVAKSIDIRSGKTGKLLPVGIWGEIDENGYDTGLPTSPHRAGQFYQVSLPPMIADSRYTVTVHPKPQSWWGRFTGAVARLFGSRSASGIADRFGRGLTEEASIHIATDHRRPNFALPHHEAVIEQQTDSEIPFYVNNLRSATIAYRRLTANGAASEEKHTITPPFVQDKQFAVPLGLRGMLGGKSGAVFGFVQTDPAIEKSDNERKLFAQVTPYNVHAKIGHFESLVWVTDFATGKPVEGANVALHQFTLSTLKSAKIYAQAKTDANGVALLPGYETMDPRGELLDQWNDGKPRLAVVVQKGEAMALLPTGYDFEVDLWRASNEKIYSTTLNRHQHMRAWGTTAQGVYRAGQTIDYKLYVRDETGRSLKAPANAEFSLSLIDPMGNVVHEQKAMALSRFGTFAGSYELSGHAAMGWYRFELKATYPDTDMLAENDGKQEKMTVTLEPMRVLVSDFTPAAFKVSNELNGTRFLGGEQAEVTTTASLYSGGAYTDAKARITAQIVPGRFHSKAFDGFRFSDDSEESERTVFEQHSPLGDKGEHSDRFTLPASQPVYGTLAVESAVADDRGKRIASESRAPFFGRDRYVGLKSPEWMYNAGKEARVLYGVADIEGKPVAGVDVAIRFEKEDVKAARVKSAGNSYQSEFITRWNKVGDCSGTSGAEVKSCAFTPKTSGYYRAVAHITDTKGRAHEAMEYLWVTGSDYVLWKDDANTALPLVPEKESYQVGDTARYLVRNPYPGATALITIERYGVIDHFVQTLEGSTPTISFTVKPDYLPGIYLSVMVVSPRVEKPVNKVGEVDLGKPAYRLGYLEVPVTDAYKEITVKPKVAKEEYRPRETVDVTLHAAPKKPGAEGQPIEVTAIVLDEAVFDLIAGGRSYFDPYKGLFELAGLDLKNYSLLTRLVGRQKFEKKGANPGGDGGVDLSLRNLFKFVAYWNPSLPVDANGNAAFHFTAPDNLTGWRVLAIAATPNDRFGLGEASFRVNRPTEIRPVMPNQLREGDDFTAQFSVMNRTGKERTLDVSIEARGALASARPASMHRKVTVAPYKRAIVSLELPVAPQVTGDDAAIDFVASASDGFDGDAIEHHVPVKRALALVTAASMGSTDDAPITTSIALPKAMRGDAGEVRVAMSPSVIGNVEGAFRYMKLYPYSCWEQRLTKALAAAQYLALKPYITADFGWDNARGLPAETLKDAATYQAPNGGMTYFRAEDAYADPYLSAYTAFAFNALRESGYTIPGDVESKLHAYLARLLRKDALPDWYDSGMRSDVRAVALAALAPHGGVDASDIARFAPHMPRMSLFGKAHFLRATLALDPQSPAVKDTVNAILAKGSESAGTFLFNETLDDGYTRILASPLRDNCAVLSSFVAYARMPGHDSSIDDVPMKLTRSITQGRGKRDHWENTQENIFCMQSLIDMARAYEKDTPDMTVTASLGGAPFGHASFHALSDKPQEAARPIGEADVGSKANVTVAKEGSGRLYAITRVTYAPTDGSEGGQNAGIALVREYSVERGGKWVLLTNPASVKRGELVRVDLYASLPTARSFVVVDDPVPGGLEPVNRDLATTSRLDADKGAFQPAVGAWWFQFGEWESYGVSHWSFYHQELGHAAVRFYSDYLPAGNYHLSYTAQAIADGTFKAPVAKAEAMYDPDIFGTSKPVTLNVGEASEE